ncbi:hypothetical protein [Shinella oryzae]|uniref:Uncharacterized protein n=1 Tax=Shinella oryzae TaxID=2871820 RepID=A0ABY9KF00_9HYPH|nr:hypothetical protein [Shinella oryzae]WLS06496.1 hypothetical protein Q9315_25070 [Shinella oryzae]
MPMKRPGDTAIDRYHNALGALGRAFDAIDAAFTGLTKVVGDDSQPIVEARGVEPRLTDAWRDLLSRIDEEMVVWARTFRKTHGTKPLAAAGHPDDEDADEADPYADVGDDDQDDWGMAASPDTDRAQ